MNRMKHHPLLTAIAAFITVMPVNPLDSQASPNPPAAAPSKEKIQIQFKIEESGGTIDFTARDAHDRATLDSLRVYGKTLEKTLRNGRFDILLAFLPPNSEFVNWVT